VTLKSELASNEAGARTQLPALAIGLILMVAVTAYPRFVVDSTGRADHLLAMAVFWAMTAGFVRGVGFIPRSAWIRRVLSGWACCIALVGVALIAGQRGLAWT
jgi:predicted membrane protein